MDPQATLERIRRGYLESDYAQIVTGATLLLEYLRTGESPPTPSEPELSALLIMALSYGEQRKARHAPNY